MRTSLLVLEHLFVFWNIETPPPPPGAPRRLSRFLHGGEGGLCHGGGEGKASVLRPQGRRGGGEGIERDLRRLMTPGKQGSADIGCKTRVYSPLKGLPRSLYIWGGGRGGTKNPGNFGFLRY